MNKTEYLTRFKDYQTKCNAYSLALSTIYYDSVTIAPKKGNDYRNEMAVILEGELYSYMNSSENIKLLEEMSKIDFDELTNKSIAQTYRHLQETCALPKDFFMKYQEATTNGYFTWQEAKLNNDYSAFAPTLKNLISLNKQKTKYIHPEMSCYDALLDHNEPGMSVKKYDVFFDLIKTRLLPFIKKLTTEGKIIDNSILNQSFPVSEQAKMMEILKQYMKYDPDECIMGVSEHPFTLPLSPHDARITTKYVEDNVMSSIFSIIHEYGHAQYMLHVNPEFDGSILARNMSNGMHESQSRLMENYLGKKKSFWVNNFNSLKKLFPGQLKSIELDEFIKYINVAVPSFIRTEADELTYPIHILIRYEIEKAIFNEDLDCDTLEQFWNDKMREYLGITPTDATTGILQDVHWSEGMFGYFPTYALGSAYAAQFFAQMEKELDVDNILSENKFEVIREWLEKNIHTYGSSLSANEIIHKLCGCEFDPNIYLDHLIEKYTAIYNL